MARTSKAQPTGDRTAAVADGTWTGDIPGFLKWCAAADDLDAYRAALTRVPPNAPWEAVSRSIRAGIEFRERTPESGHRVQAPDVFLATEPDGDELRAAKKAILEAEITRRALA
jgi:hypothetical protein